MLVKWMSLDFIYIFTFAKKKDCNLSTSICRSTRPYLDCNVSTIFFLPNQHIVTIGPGYVHFGMAKLYLGLAFFNPRQFFLLFNPSPSPAHGRPLHTDKRNTDETDETEETLISKTEQLKISPNLCCILFKPKT